MTRTKNILPSRRKIAVLASLVFLLAAFMIPYFLVFIPMNADNLKRQAFLKLSRAAQNIVTKTNDTRNYYLNDRIEKSQPKTADEIRNSECSTNGTQHLPLRDSLFFSYSGSEGWEIYFTQSVDTKKQKFFVRTQSLPLFIAPCLSSAKEIFSSFLLLHYCRHIEQDTAGKILYQDLRQGFEQEMTLDSLTPRHNGIRSPDIEDITLEGADYKIFSYPFLLGRHRMILCGLLKTDTYNSKIHQIPIGVFYTLAICLTIFLLSLPFLKIFMMNARDRIYAFNLVQAVIFLFVMSSFITIIITQLVLLWQGRSQIRSNLQNLSAIIEDSLTAELQSAQHEMNYYDSSLGSLRHSDNRGKAGSFPPDSPYAFVTTGSVHPDMAIKNKNRILVHHDPFYHNADHIAWFDEDGQELIRIRYVNALDAQRLDHKKEVDTEKFLKVNARPYYQEMVRGWKYVHDTGATVLLAAVQSWASGEFRVNICKYSGTGVYMMEVMDTRLYSLVNTVLPEGYGFCLMDESGDVKIHSDTLKSLRENFIEETGAYPPITGAIKGRQTFESDNIAFYGGSYALRIQPLRQHPLYLAVFYNNDFLEPMNLRILTFSIFFCLMGYGLLFLIFKTLYKTHPPTCLYTPMDYYARMIPMKEKINQYYNGSVYLLIYITIFIAASILGPLIGRDTDYSMLVFGVLAPFNILYTIWLMHYLEIQTPKWNPSTMVWPFLFIAAVIFVFSRFTGWGLEPVSFWTIELSFALLLFIVIRKNGTFRDYVLEKSKGPIKKILFWNKRTWEQKKLISYSSFITLFIFAVAILPTLAFSWFAYNHELWQSIKKEQLEIADGLQKREHTVRAFLRTHQPDFSAHGPYFDNIQYTKGIYPVYHDLITHVQDSDRSSTTIHSDHSDSFYLLIARTINLFYRDPSNLSPLYNHTREDQLWDWDLNGNTSDFEYRKPKWKIPPSEGVATGSSPVTLRIHSSLRAGFKLDPPLLALFGSLVLMLVMSVYWIIKTFVRQVYLTRIIGDLPSGTFLSPLIDKTELWKTAHSQNKFRPGIKDNWPSADDLVSRISAEYKTFSSAVPGDIVAKETEIIATACDLEPVFETVWKMLDDKERYLLYCLANDGLINQKNESLILGLLYKKLLLIHDQRIQLISYSFRDFIISRNNTDAEKTLLKKMQSEGSWNFVRTILIVVTGSVFIFLFLTQQEVSAKIVAIATSLTALVPLLLKYGTKSSGEEKK